MESVPCVSVSALTAELFEEWTQTLDEFEGQGHRSKLKVTRLKDMISEVSSGLVFVHSVMTRRHLIEKISVIGFGFGQICVIFLPI